jgi:outer membrane receptor for ferrienterochelin and colicin
MNHEAITKKRRHIGFGLAVMLVLVFFSQLLWAKNVTITPSIELSGVYDDNLDFASKDEEDSFGANAVPRLTLDYASELLQFFLIGEVDVIKYFSETDYDRTNQFYGIDGQYQMSPRWRFAGNFEYRWDETIDSVLEETGQSFKRTRVKTYDSGAGLFFQLTELSDIGFETDYRKRDYGSDRDTDFDRYTFSLPYTKHFSNERDIVSLGPSYTIFDSEDSEDGKDYRFEIEWERQISETFTSTVNAGGRYTDIDQEGGSSDSNWGYIGKLGLRKRTETFFGEIEASRDIRANSNAEIVEVNRLILRANQKLSERFGFKFYGSGYYTGTESTNAKDEKTTFFELNPSLYYFLTENHILEFRYQYQTQKELDRPGNPVTQRNQVWLGIVLQFPKKWN